MPFFLLPFIPYIATAIAGVIAAEFLRRPISDATEGFLLTEEMPARTSLRLYIEGIMDEAAFRDNMRKHNIRQDHQDFMVTFGKKEIADRSKGLIAKQQDALVKRLEGSAGDLVELEVNAADKTTKELESDLEKIDRELLKVTQDEFIDAAEVDIKEYESDIRILERMIPAAKPVKV